MFSVDIVDPYFPCLKTYKIALLSSNSLGLWTLNCCFLATHQFVHQCEGAAAFRQVTSCESWLQQLVHIFQLLSTQKANGKLAIARRGTEKKTESIILLLCKLQCTCTLDTIWPPHQSTIGRAIEGVEKSSRNPRLETRISIWEKRHQDAKWDIYVVINNGGYSDFVTIQNQCQTGLLEQKPCSPRTWSCSPVVAVEIEAGMLMKENILCFNVHFDLEDMWHVGNHGLPSQFQPCFKKFCRTFCICLQLLLSLTGHGAASHQHSIETGKEMQHKNQKQLLKLFSYPNLMKKLLYNNVVNLSLRQAFVSTARWIL